LTYTPYMTPLSILLLIKIFGTLFTVALPLVFLPRAIIDERSGFETSDITLYRFYGVAVLALLVGYLAGYYQIQAGVFPIGVLAMGFVSNAGAALIFFVSGRIKKAPLSASFFSLIALGLAIAFFAPNFAMRPLWVS